jgi:hypothetical protein
MIKLIIEDDKIKTIKEKFNLVFDINKELPENVLKNNSYGICFFEFDQYFSTEEFFELINKISKKEFYFLIIHMGYDLIFTCDKIVNFDEWNNFLESDIKIEIYSIEIDWVWKVFSDKCILIDSDLKWGYFHINDQPNLFIFQKQYRDLIFETSEALTPENTVDLFGCYESPKVKNKLQSEFRKNYIK